MASDGTSRWQLALRLLFVALFVVPLVAQLFAVGAGVAESLGVGVPDFASLDSTTAGQAVGLAVAVVIVVLLVRQKRRSRGQRPSEDPPEQAGDRTVEGSGEVYAPYAYNNQQAARRESRRIRNRAEEIAEAERDAYEKR